MMGSVVEKYDDFAGSYQHILETVANRVMLQPRQKGSFLDASTRS
jgi:hypothetical protein